MKTKTILKHYMCTTKDCTQKGLPKPVQYPVNEYGVALTHLVVCGTCDQDAAEVK